jgi:succinate dehydrogenase / fumarate reductase flavoprotein subunit
MGKAGATSDRGRVRRVIVVGGGLAGLMTTLKLCEAGVPVLLVSLLPARRSHSVCAQGGINASVNTKGEGDSPRIHLEETLYGGDFLANQPPVNGMTQAAPGLIHLLDRMGVPFNRTPEGRLDFRRFGGSLYHRTAFAGATTGQQLVYALDDQVRRFETVDVTDEHGIAIPGERLVRRLEHLDLVGLVRDDNGVAVGIVTQDLHTMRCKAFPADAVCLATGGLGAVFGRSTNSTQCTGSASAVAFRAGAVYANGEFIQVHPTAIPGADKLRLISESARGEGGRIWVPKDARDGRAPVDIPEGERDYFLERLYPGYGNLVPRDIAARAIFRLCLHEGRGLYDANAKRNEHAVYLDVTHIDRRILQGKLAGILEIYAKFAGEDPYTTPMRVFPAVHYSMGGLWVDFEADASGDMVVGSPRNHATSIPGLYAVGECDYQYHGANRLGANSLLSCLYGGLVTGPAIATYRDSLARSAFDLPGSVFDRAETAQVDAFEALLKRDSDQASENGFQLHDELGEIMLRECTTERTNAGLEHALEKIDELRDRSARVEVGDPAGVLNQSVQHLRHLDHMLLLARVVASGALRRQECRGAHYKPALDPELEAAAPGRDDANWLRTTLATCGERDEIRFVDGFTYECAGTSVSVSDAVDTSLVSPRARSYAKAGATHASPTAEEPR